MARRPGEPKLIPISFRERYAAPVDRPRPRKIRRRGGREAAEAARKIEIENLRIAAARLAKQTGGPPGPRPGRTRWKKKERRPPRPSASNVYDTRTRTPKPNRNPKCATRHVMKLASSVHGQDRTGQKSCGRSTLAPGRHRMADTAVDPSTAIACRSAAHERADRTPHRGPNFVAFSAVTARSGAGDRGAPCGTPVAETSHHAEPENGLHAEQLPRSNPGRTP
jgi:hypothetical protein